MARTRSRGPTRDCRRAVVRTLVIRTWAPVPASDLGPYNEGIAGHSTQFVAALVRLGDMYVYSPTLSGQ